MVPILSGEQVGVFKPLLEAFIKAAIVLGLIFIVGRIILRPILKMIVNYGSSKINEIFIAATILIALGSAWLTQYMGLSLALGAFAAGLLVSETEFRSKAEESIAPFKGIFLGLFFMSVGMSIDMRLFINNAAFITSLSIGLILLKAAIIISLCLIFKFNWGHSVHTGLLLAQGSEFAFILFRLDESKEILNIKTVEIMLLVVTITMAITPLIANLGLWISKKINKDKENKQEYMQLSLF